MTIGERIKYLRTQSGMSQVELAEKLNTTPQAVYKYEKEIVTNIPMDKIELLGNVFNVPPSYIMGWRGGIGDRIKTIRQDWDLSAEEFADIIESTKENVESWEEGLFDPNDEQIKRIANAFDISIDILLSDNILMLNNLRPRLRLGKKSIKIPVLGDVAAGIPIEAITDVLDYEEISPDLVKDGSEFFALRIKGDSMEPKISDGDVVIVRKQEDVDSGQIAIVCVNGEYATCKKVMKQSEGILLQPLNPSFTPTFYTTEDIETLPITILGRVVELRAKF